MIKIYFKKNIPFHEIQANIISEKYEKINSVENLVFFQSLQIKSIFIAIFARLIGVKKIYYYLHEPFGLKDRIRLNHGLKLAKSIVEYFLNFAMGQVVSCVIVDNQMSKKRAVENLVPIDKIMVAKILTKKYVRAPLLNDTHPSKKIGILGRIDAKRNYLDIIKRCPEHTFYILTSSAVSYDEKNVTVVSQGVLFDETQKLEFLNQIDMLCVYQDEDYNQSAVVSEAILSNVPIIISSKDPNEYFIKKYCVGIVWDGITDLTNAIKNFQCTFDRLKAAENEYIRKVDQQWLEILRCNQQ